MALYVFLVKSLLVIPHKHTETLEAGFTVDISFCRGGSWGGESVSTDCWVVKRENRNGMTAGPQLLGRDWDACQGAQGRPWSLAMTLRWGEEPVLLTSEEPVSGAHIKGRPALCKPRRWILWRGFLKWTLLRYPRNSQTRSWLHRLLTQTEKQELPKGEFVDTLNLECQKKTWWHDWVLYLPRG